VSETVPDPRDFRAGWILRRAQPDPRDARIAELEAEVARLEALIAEQGSSGVVTDETYTEYARIRSRR